MRKIFVKREREGQFQAPGDCYRMCVSRAPGVGEGHHSVLSPLQCWPPYPSLVALMSAFSFVSPLQIQVLRPMPHRELPYSWLLKAWGVTPGQGSGSGGGLK